MVWGREYNDYVEKLGSRLELFHDFLEETEPHLKKDESLGEMVSLKERRKLKKQVKKALDRISQGKHEEAFSTVNKNAELISFHANVPVKARLYSVWNQELQKEFGPQVAVAPPLEQQALPFVTGVETLFPSKKDDLDQAINKTEKKLEKIAEKHGKNSLEWQDKKQDLDLLEKAKKHGFDKIIAVNPVGRLVSYDNRFGEKNVLDYYSPKDGFQHEKSHAESRLAQEPDVWSATLDEVFAYTKKNVFHVLAAKPSKTKDVKTRVEKLEEGSSVTPHELAYVAVTKMHKKGLTKQDLKKKMEEKNWNAKQTLFWVSPELKEIEEHMKETQRQKYVKYMHEFRGLLKQVTQIEEREKEWGYTEAPLGLKNKKLEERKKMKKSLETTKKEQKEFFKKLKTRLKLFHEFLEETEPFLRQNKNMRKVIPLQNRKDLKKTVKDVIKKLDQGTPKKMKAAMEVLMADYEMINFHANMPVRDEIHDAWDKELRKEFGPHVILAPPIQKWSIPFTNTIRDTLGLKSKGMNQMIQEVEKQKEKARKNNKENHVKICDRQLELLKRAKKHRFQRIIGLTPAGTIRDWNNVFGNLNIVYESPHNAFVHENNHFNSKTFNKYDYVWGDALEELLAYEPRHQIYLLTSKGFTINEIQEKVEMMEKHRFALAHEIGGYVLHKMHKNKISKKRLKKKLEKPGWGPKKILFHLAPELKEVDKKMKKAQHKQRKRTVYHYSLRV
jgi:hypothetical protein